MEQIDNVAPDRLEVGTDNSIQELTIATDLEDPPSPSAWLSQTAARAISGPKGRHRRQPIRNVYMTPPLPRTGPILASTPTTPSLISRSSRSSQSSSRSSSVKDAPVTLFTPGKAAIAIPMSSIATTPPPSLSWTDPCRHPFLTANTFKVGEYVDPRFGLSYFATAATHSSSPTLSTAESFHSACSYFEEAAGSQDANSQGSSSFNLNDGEETDSSDDEESIETMGITPVAFVRASSLPKRLTGRLLRTLCLRSSQKDIKKNRHMAWSQGTSEMQPSEAAILLSWIRELKISRAGLHESARSGHATSSLVETTSSNDQNATDCSAGTSVSESDDNASRRSSKETVEVAAHETLPVSNKPSKPSMLRRACDKLKRRHGRNSKASTPSAKVSSLPVTSNVDITSSLLSKRATHSIRLLLDRTSRLTQGAAKCAQ